MVINGHELTEGELGQAYREYQRICDKEDLVYRLEEMSEYEECIPQLTEEEIERIAENLVDQYREAVDNITGIRDYEIWTAEDMIMEEFE